MQLGTTEVLHDLESKTDVGHCADPGCYSRVVNYSATIRQMTALSKFSNECHQALKVKFLMYSLQVRKSGVERKQKKHYIDEGFFASTIVYLRLLKLTISLTRGGMIRIQTQGIFGQEATKVYTLVSAD